MGGVGLFRLKKEAFMYLIEINTFICCAGCNIVNLTQDDKLNTLFDSLSIGLAVACIAYITPKHDHKLSNLSLVLIRCQIMSQAKYNLLAWNAYT